MDTPLVLVHADRYRYPWPVMANVIPNQEGLGLELEAWIKHYASSAQQEKARKSHGMSKAVLVTMPHEASFGDFPPIAPLTKSARRDGWLAMP